MELSPEADAHSYLSYPSKRLRLYRASHKPNPILALSVDSVRLIERT